MSNVRFWRFCKTVLLFLAILGKVFTFYLHVNLVGNPVIVVISLLGLYQNKQSDSEMPSMNK